MARGYSTASFLNLKRLVLDLSIQLSGLVSEFRALQSEPDSDCWLGVDGDCCPRCHKLGAGTPFKVALG